MSKHRSGSKPRTVATLLVPVFCLCRESRIVGSSGDIYRYDQRGDRWLYRILFQDDRPVVYVSFVLISPLVLIQLLMVYSCSAAIGSPWAGSVRPFLFHFIDECVDVLFCLLQIPGQSPWGRSRIFGPMMGRCSGWCARIFILMLCIVSASHRP